MCSIIEQAAIIFFFHPIETIFLLYTCKQNVFNYVPHKATVLEKGFTQ